MGLRRNYFDFIEFNISKIFKSNSGLKMLELGNQQMRQDADTEFKTGKEYFKSIGFDHTSVDLNGKDGALKKDLRNPEHFTEYKEYFDIISNPGTTEHVLPHETQYACFKNLHNCLKPGGLLICLNPDIGELRTFGAWAGHCRIYYSDAFYDFFEKQCACKLLESRIINGLRCCALQKENNSKFTDKKDEFLSLIHFI